MCTPPLRPPPLEQHASQPATFAEAAALVAAEMVKLLVTRHQKYGPANIARHGEKGCVVRMGDKLARLERAYGLTPTCWKCQAPYGGDEMEALEEAEFSDESVEDAWLDGGNYPLVALMVRRGWWHLPFGPPEPPWVLEPDVEDDVGLRSVVGIALVLAVVVAIALTYVLVVLR